MVMPGTLQQLEEIQIELELWKIRDELGDEVMDKVTPELLRAC